MSFPGVVVAVDVDNLLISSAGAGQSFEDYAGSEVGFDNMFRWVRTFGEILCVHLYLPAFQSNNDPLWHALWEKYKNKFLFEAVYCPRKRPSQPREKPDNVDAHLICHSRRIVRLYDRQVKYFCLASGDLDYSPFLWELKRERGVEIAFELGSEESFSKVYRQVNPAAKHPLTGGELIHYFLPRKE